MAARSVELTEHLSRFVDEQVRCGRHQNVSEVVREALRRYEASRSTGMGAPEARQLLREQAEHSQAEAERHLRLYEAILTTTPDLAYIFDLQHRFAYANEGLLRMWGRTREEALGKTCLELGYPDWHAAMHDREIEQVVATGQPIRGEVPFNGTFGRRVYDYIFTPVIGPSGNVEAVAGTTRDVTDYKQVEEALRASEARLKAIFDTAPVGILFAEAPSGRIVAANRQVETIHGHPVLYSPDVESYREWVAYHADGRFVQIHEFPMARALAGEECAELTVLYQRPDGSKAWVRYIATPIRIGGEIVGGLVATLDIDQETRALEALAQTRDELEDRVRTEVAAREEAQARLVHSQRMEALGQLAGGVAHDFNNVLQAVQGGASLIERRPIDPDGVRRLARMILEAAERGSSITRRLLAFSRRGDLRAEAVSPVALLAGMREILIHTLGAGIGVRVDAPPDLPPLLADKGQLETVLVNLATNARDAMDGNGYLTLAASIDVLHEEDGPSHPADLKPGSYVRLSVMDNGCGMAPGTLARVTEPFFTTKQHGQGTGLGLAMAKGFAQQSGGGLRVQSELGRGTTVELWFPLAHLVPATPRAPASEEAASTRTQRARLLVVDDEPFVREILVQGLEAEGYTVVAASSGPGALALLDAGQAIDLIISDLSMPDMDGLMLIREAQRRRQKLPAILLTGFANNAAELALTGTMAGTFTLLRKPVSGRLIAERVSKLLGRITM